MKKPTFFVIGAPKCGTTALAQYLSEHPKAFMSRPKEPQHYCSDFGYFDFKNRCRYLSLFSNVDSDIEVIGEASATYLLSRRAVPNILEDIYKPKFIVMLRNPVDMAHALHEQLYFSGDEVVRNFEQAWNLQEERRGGNSIPRSCREPSFLQYRKACSLGEQASRLLDYVDRDSVLFVFLEDLRNEPRKLWLQVQDFLGLEDDGRSVFPLVNQAKEWRFPIVPRITRVYKELQRIFGISPIGTGILKSIQAGAVRVRKRKPLEAGFRQRLLEEFEEDILLLSRVTAKDLAHWVEHSDRVVGE